MTLVEALFLCRRNDIPVFTVYIVQAGKGGLAILRGGKNPTGPHDRGFFSKVGLICIVSSIVLIE
jgi:hypothetical protein